ncbi:hypothetical protein [uncultured Desulfovibrio sp.]|uniref:hypothetical protein n=1 Tax=uncultured Desulfovibrio sp. TaxID=167968 RepID=UPI0026313DAE|nr:hypothetical protein [uncultured Desulfovibrio sp.]
MPDICSIDGDWEDWLSDIWDEVDSIISESRLRWAVVNATNDTLRHMRTYLSREIRATYYVKKADIDAAMRLYKARQRGWNIKGSLSFRYRQSLPLSQFGARQGKTYVSVKVLKAHRARRIRPGGDKKIMATGKGRAAVWIAKGHVMARVEDRKKPLVLYGPSFMAFFHSPEKEEMLAREENTWMLKRLRHHVQRQAKTYYD